MSEDLLPAIVRLLRETADKLFSLGQGTSPAASSVKPVPTRTAFGAVTDAPHTGPGGLTVEPLVGTTFDPLVPTTSVPTDEPEAVEFQPKPAGEDIPPAPAAPAA